MDNGDHEFTLDINSTRTLKNYVPESMYGTLAKSYTNDLEDVLIINPKDVTHKVNKVYEQDGKICANVTILDHNVKDTIKNLIDDNKVSLAPRCLIDGSNNNVMKLVSFDIVTKK